MIRIVLAVFLAFCAPAMAEVVKVASGEHDSFTRLVLDLPEAGEWRLGRTATGYEFATVSGAQPRYDLTSVWDRIPKSRLQAIFADPETGALRLVLTCVCHAFPFEFQPGTVVIDLRDGPPPPGSVFETAFDAPDAQRAAMADTTAEKPTPDGYDWLAAGAVPSSIAPYASEMPLPIGAISLAPLRNALLEEISRGAAEGIVEMNGPSPESKPDTAEGDLPWARIAIGEMPGIVAGADRKSAADLQPDGEACIPDETLDIANWAGPEPGAQQLAEARAGLMEEFDIPDPQAIRHAVRTHLALGFGAEALQYTKLLDAPPEPDLVIYTSMARIVDGQDDPTSPFARMLQCDTAAALWAALLHDRLPEGSDINTNAILRSFAALPPNLRQLFGPDLANRFLQRGDAEAARMLRDATARAPDTAAQELALVDAQIDLAGGNDDTAAALADKALMDGAAGAMEAAITLVEARFEMAEPITDDLLATVQSYQREAAGTPSEADLQRALALALALSAQPAAALEASKALPETQADVWRAISLRATDAQLISVAVLPDTAEVPLVASEVALGLATRLTDLGFADSALDWLVRTSADDSGFPLAAAKAQLQRSDAAAAVALLNGETGPEVEAVRAVALERIGDLDPAQVAWRAAGDTVQAERLAVWRRDWPGLSTDGSDPWKSAAILAVAPVSRASPTDGLLKQGATMVEDSAAARQAIAALLAAVPAPAAGP